MFPQSQPTVPPHLEDRLLEWEARQHRGDPVSPHDLCPDSPAEQADLARLIGLLGRVDRLIQVDSDLPATQPTVAGDAPPFDRFAGYEIRGELGRGGMGVVYLAWDPTLKREVALKMIRRAGGHADRQLAARFEREAQLLAQLKHPHIVPVYEARVHDGVPYFVMERMAGSLTGRRAGLVAAGPAVVVPLLAAVARAVDHAHVGNVLHRDLKPGNILLDEAGSPKVADFGLAKVLRGDDAGTPANPPRPADEQARLDTPMDAEALTLSGARLGTLSYMAPELLAEEAGEQTPRSDVWALGVIAYELLTGRPPFPPADGQAAADAICQADLVAPRALNPVLDPALEAVVVKCLSKDPARRYATAGALADDLDAWRRGEPPSVYPESRRQRAVRWLRRHPTWAAVAGLLVAFGVAAGAYVARPEPLTADEREEQRYRQAVRRHERDLAAGRAVTLVGPNTTELPSRWRFGEGKVAVQTLEDGKRVVTVTASSNGLLELLPDPQVKAYRVRATLQHTRLGHRHHSGELAIAFACRHCPTHQGSQWIYARAHIAELGRQANAFRSSKTGEPRRVFQFQLCLLGTSDKYPVRTFNHKVSWISYPPPPKGEPEAPWRQVEVEVREKKYQATWLNQTIEADPVVEGPKALDGMGYNNPDLRGAPRDFPVRGPLCLYVVGSTLSIERFTVEPLDE